MRKAILLSIFLLLFVNDCAQSSSVDAGPLQGKAAPDFAIPALNGRTQSLASQKGKVVVLDFWATWCPPCVASLPHTQKIATDADLAGKGLVVWAINQGEENKIIQDFIDQNHYSFTVLKDDGAVGSKYVSEGIPTMVIIGRDGIVRNVYTGIPPQSADLEKFFQQVDADIKKAIDEPAMKNPI